VLFAERLPAPDEEKAQSLETANVLSRSEPARPDVRPAFLPLEVPASAPAPTGPFVPIISEPSFVLPAPVPEPPIPEVSPPPNFAVEDLAEAKEAREAPLAPPTASALPVPKPRREADAVAQHLVSMLRSPDSLVAAMVLREILDRPRCQRRQRS